MKISSWMVYNLIELHVIIMIKLDSLKLHKNKGFENWLKRWKTWEARRRVSIRRFLHLGIVEEEEA